MSILEIREVTSGYGEVQILWGADLKLEKGKLTSLVGTNGAGSGALDLALAVKALEHNTVPPSLHTENPDPASRLRLSTDGPCDAPIQNVMSLAYALGGGQNAGLVIRRYQE